MGAVAEESSGATADGWESPSVVQAVGRPKAENGTGTFPVRQIKRKKGPYCYGPFKNLVELDRIELTTS